MTSLWVKGRQRQSHALLQGPRGCGCPECGSRRLGLDDTVSVQAPATWRTPSQLRPRVPGRTPVVIIPHDLEDGKTVTTATYGGKLLAVEGNYDDVNRLCSELIGDPLTNDWGFNVNLRPYYAEGSETVGYEIAEQLGWRLPDQVVIPIASGALLVKVDKAFRELLSWGSSRTSRTRSLAQATGCSPVYQALEAGHDVVRPVKPDTIAKSLAIGNPADGPYALDVVRRTGGSIGSVSDDQVVDGIRRLARTEGVFAETAGGVVLATLEQLLASGKLDPKAETVILNTGDGLKTLDAVSTSSGQLRRFVHRFLTYGEATFCMSGEVTVRFRRFCVPTPGGEAEVTADASATEGGETLAGVLQAFVGELPRHPAGTNSMIPALRRFVNVYVGDEDVGSPRDWRLPPGGTQIRRDSLPSLGWLILPPDGLTPTLCVECSCWGV